ncbi:MAG: shikimate dehydrogenase [Nitrospirota bacterium]|nr:shikimate dehydrogenase [Patescibacteria group bacterium]
MKIYGVIGYPCAHSMSPVIHNAGFEALNIDAKYEIFETQDLAGFIKKGGFDGLSVTMPYKQEIIRYLEQIDDATKAIGACNCVNGTHGFNTDSYGAMVALEEVAAIGGKNVYLLGTGGAASAIYYGLMEESANVTVFNRNLEEASKFMDNFGVLVKLLNELDENFDILINATSCGFKSDESCVPMEILKPGKVVMDVVYEPLETRLLRDAKAAGCTTVSGENMLLHQAVKQFEIWTGETAPVDIMRGAIYSFLKKSAPSSSSASTISSSVGSSSFSP